MITKQKDLSTQILMTLIKTTLSKPLYNRIYCGLITVNNTAYAIDGHDPYLNNSPYGSIEKFENGKWTHLETKLKYHRKSPTVALFNGKIFIVGGISHYIPPDDDFLICGRSLPHMLK